MTVVCPECLQPGRGVALVRRLDGLDIAVQGESPLILVTSEMPNGFAVNQERMNRKPSMGWTESISNNEVK